MLSKCKDLGVDRMTWEDIMKKDYVNLDEELEDLENQVEEYRQLSNSLGEIASAAIKGYTYSNMPENKRKVYDKAIEVMKEMEKQIKETVATHNKAIKNFAKLLDKDNSIEDVKDFISENI